MFTLVPLERVGEDATAAAAGEDGSAAGDTFWPAAFWEDGYACTAAAAGEDATSAAAGEDGGDTGNTPHTSLHVSVSGCCVG